MGCGAELCAACFYDTYALPRDGAVAGTGAGAGAGAGAGRQ